MIRFNSTCANLHHCVYRCTQDVTICQYCVSSPPAGSVRELQGGAEGAEPGEDVPVPGVRQGAAGSGQVQQLEFTRKYHHTKDQAVDSLSLSHARRFIYLSVLQSYQ